MTGGHYWAITTAPPARLGDGGRGGYLERLEVELVNQGCTLERAHAGLRSRWALDGAHGPIVRIFDDIERRGQVWNFLRALRDGLAAGAGRITILEDDIEICRGFVDRVEAQPIPPDCAFVSWFDPFIGMPRVGAKYHVTIPTLEPFPELASMVRRPCAAFYCNQALTFPPVTAALLAQSTIAHNWPKPHDGDVMIARAFRGATYGVHFPSLVQHVGAVSLCNPGQPLQKNRISHHYGGPGFDAGALEVFA